MNKPNGHAEPDAYTLRRDLDDLGDQVDELNDRIDTMEPRLDKTHDRVFMSNGHTSLVSQVDSQDTLLQAIYSKQEEASRERITHSRATRLAIATVLLSALAGPLAVRLLNPGSAQPMQDISNDLIRLEQKLDLSNRLRQPVAIPALEVEQLDPPQRPQRRKPRSRPSGNSSVRNPRLDVLSTQAVPPTGLKEDR